MLHYFFLLSEQVSHQSPWWQPKVKPGQALRVNTRKLKCTSNSSGVNGLGLLKWDYSACL